MTMGMTGFPAPYDVLFDAVTEQGGVWPEEGSPRTHYIALGLALGGHAEEVARHVAQSHMGGLVNGLWRELRETHRKVPLSLAHHALVWHCERMADVLRTWGHEGPLNSPRWALSTQIRFDRFVALLWHPSHPRIAVRWHSHEREGRSLPREVALRSLAEWRGPCFPHEAAPPIDGWEVHSSDLSPKRRLRRDREEA